jgi:hypothetical protein
VDITFQSVDAALNLGWVLVSVGILLLSWRTGRAREHKQALLAVLFILVLLFPVISTADDSAEQALMYELAASPLSVKSTKEIKQVIVPAAQLSPAVALAAPSLVRPVGERLEADCFSSFTLRLSSASGIHSPPQV